MQNAQNKNQGHSQSAGQDHLLAHESSPQSGSAFKLHSEYQPTGDQPQAIEKLVKGFKEGNQCQTLLGVTGSGKTFTMANVIQALNKPTLVLAHTNGTRGACSIRYCGRVRSAHINMVSLTLPSRK